LIKSFTDFVPFLLAIFSVFTYTDEGYLSSLIPEDKDLRLKICLILSTAVIQMWMYHCSWSNGFFLLFFSLFSMITLTHVSKETE